MAEFYILTVNHPLSRENFFRSVLKEKPPFYWGLRPGKSNDLRWARLAEGDIIAFKKDGVYCATARVAGKMESRSLAVSLWGCVGDRDSWELIIVLERPLLVNVPAGDLAPFLGMRHAGLSRITRERIDRARAVFGRKQFESWFGI